MTEQELSRRLDECGIPHDTPLPGKLLTSRPLKLVLDRRPFI